MAIKVTKPGHDGCYFSLEAKHGATTQEHFAGRVLKVEKRIENRNFSHTLDYTDFRDIECTVALVWMGTHGPAQSQCWIDNGTALSYSYLTFGEKRDLEFFEQFVYVDCTNLHTEFGEHHAEATADAEGGDPLMWANYLAFQAYKAGLADKAAKEKAEREAAEAKKEAARLARAAKKEAKEAELKATAEVQLGKIPAKGTEVTVDGFTGRIFWIGVSKYRGQYSARAGVKNSRGEVAWIDAAKFV